MGFPNVVYGNYGDEKVTSTAKIGNLPLGTKMELPDGRVYRHAKLGGTAAVAGKLYSGKGMEANTTLGKPLVVPNAAAVGATAVIATIAGTALGANVFDGGYLSVASSVGTGIGYLYKIKTASTCAAASTSTVKLEESDKIVVALEAGTTLIMLRKNQYDEVLLTANDTTGVNTFAGVACATAAASAYIWLQRRGPAAVFTDATTPIIGIPVVASSTVAGAIATPVLTGTAINAVSVSKQALPVGICMAPGASADFTMVDLTLE